MLKTYAKCNSCCREYRCIVARDFRQCVYCRKESAEIIRSEEENKPLLTIELQDESSVPKVIYKGEEIKLKQEVEFHWETDTEEYGGLSYAIEHAVEGKIHPTRNRIERRVKGHALI